MVTKRVIALMTGAALALGAADAVAASCKRLTISGPGGRVAIQVDEAGYLQWGITIPPPYATMRQLWAGWFAVNGRAQRLTPQNHPYHGSLKPTRSKPGDVFTIAAAANFYAGGRLVARAIIGPNNCMMPSRTKEWVPWPKRRKPH